MRASIRRLPALALLLTWTAAVLPAARAGELPLRLADARQQGTFNSPGAKAVLSRVFLPAAKRDVLKIDYAVPQGTAAGIWAKSFPEPLRADNADAVRLDVRTIGSDPARPVSLALEIKGTSGVQRVPLDAQPVERPVDWQTIGTLTEVVALVQRVGNGAPAVGTVCLDIGFEKLPVWRALGAMIGPRILGVFLASVLLSLLAGTAGTIHKAVRRVGRAQRAPPTPLIGDFVLGAGIVLIIALSVVIYHLGARSGLEAGWSALAVAAAGAGVAWWFTYGLTGKHLTPAEALQDALVSGLLAASASSMRLLQAPGTWSEMLLLCGPVAAIVALVYHAANAARLATSGRHVSAIAGATIVGTPYAAGLLLLLEAGDLVQWLAGGLTLGTLTAFPAVLRSVGAGFALLAFNEVVANGISLATKRTLLRSPRAHRWLVVVSAAAVVAPRIADFGSSSLVAGWPAGLRLTVVLATTIASQAGLWAEVYLITGLIMDAIHGRAPSAGAMAWHPLQGMKKGAVYSGVFMAILYGFGWLINTSGARWLASQYPLLAATLFGAMVFPLVKTVIETFDGSQAFFRRMRMSYRRPTLYARGAVVGGGVAFALLHAWSQQDMLARSWLGFCVGAMAFAGVNVLRDALYGLLGRGRLQSWRPYAVAALLGGFIGAAVGFYLDQAQISVVVAKFHCYLAVGQTPEPYGVYPFLSKWGFIRLGDVTGGVNLLLAEALAGVISWSIPAWLFAINRTLMSACFRREASPIKALFTRQGLVDLVQNMIEVLRWGLWMSPIINSFLRPVGEPTWYNQDGAIRTLVAIFQDATTSPTAFRAWSLQMFIWLLAYDVVRVLIWLDHMGLRVATLVNLSFLGMDKLDERLARFLGPAATARCIPEGVKRFTTWAPLLIPFYIPRGLDWDYAWSQSEALQAAHGPGLLATLMSLPLSGKLLWAAGAVVLSTATCAAIRWLGRRWRRSAPAVVTLSNAGYEVVVKQNGEIYSHDRERGYDITRRSYDLLDPAGRTLFVVDTAEDTGAAERCWPLLGNFPAKCGAAPRIEQDEDRLRVVGAQHELRTTLEISLPDVRDSAELWTITVENLADRPRQLKLVPYLEWVLNRPDADRGHTQYNRLFAEMEYHAGLRAVLAWDKHSRAMGMLAADAAPEGFLTSRVDFIGRARSIWAPRVAETLRFRDAVDTEPHPTFDPIGSLLLPALVGPRGSFQLRLLIGMAGDREQAIDLIARHLGSGNAHCHSERSEESPPLAGILRCAQDDNRCDQDDKTVAGLKRKIRSIGHGEIPPGTPQPYSEFAADGRTLLVHTPFTPRPYDHTMSNELGHVTVVTNRGLHTSSSGNSQQNRLTPDWPDTVTREVPGEAMYLYEPETTQWYSPTYHPLNDAEARHQVALSVDGAATYRMTKGTLSTELTVFVPPEDPTGVYLLTVRNAADTVRRLRFAPYFQIVLADQPEHAGPLRTAFDRELSALLFENPRNGFRRGPAFVAMSAPVERVETLRGPFFGHGRDVARPSMLEHGLPDAGATEDARPIAALLTTLDVPAHGQCTVAVVLGQADNRRQAAAVIRKYQDLSAVRRSLDQTRKWWLDRADTVQVRTSQPAMDHYLDWLKYQALAERIWARRGFYQASGAFGFRDQLQDAVNLMWMDPGLARRQILLHAAQQFLEGDVVHWFHLLPDGRTGFAARTHASDNLLWLPWAVAEYVAATGDQSILDQSVPYLEAEQPLEPLPTGKHGMGFNPLRSSRADSVYRHALAAIDLVLQRRMGAHGLPLIGTGDWNDGLDEIGSQGRGESVWLGLFLYYILRRMAEIVESRDGPDRRQYYHQRAEQLKNALQSTWRDDRYLRAIHDDGTEIGVRDSGVWEIDALTAAWAVMSGIDSVRSRAMFDTALQLLERNNTILLGSPPLREDTSPYLGRSSRYPEGVRENGMYCHGVQWLVGAARLLAEQCQRDGQPERAAQYRQTAYRLWRKISPIPHVAPGRIECYGGQPNKQAADLVTTGDSGRMIWHGYTGAAGWLLRQALEGVIGMRLVRGEAVPPDDLQVPRDGLTVMNLELKPKRG